MKPATAICMALLAFMLPGCGGDDDGANGGPIAAEWSYEGDTGPEHWGALSPEYAACSGGQEQSPIDIEGASPSLEPALQIDYHLTPLVIFNNGHTIEVEYHEGSTLTVDGETWEVVQFHFHAHSEHTVGGTATPLELHVVHRDESGALAVLGVFIEEGAGNEALAAVFDHLPSEEGEPEEVEGVEINIGDVLPESLAAWRYDGSLTTPPCSEGVRWHVLSKPIEASPEQIGAFEAIFGNNYRPTQPLNGRTTD